MTRPVFTTPRPSHTCTGKSHHFKITVSKRFQKQTIYQLLINNIITGGQMNQTFTSVSGMSLRGVTCSTCYRQVQLILPWCYRWNCQSIEFTHKITNLVWLWRIPLQVTKNFVTALSMSNNNCLQSIPRQSLNKMKHATTYHGNNRSTGHMFHQPRKERKMTQVSIMRSQMVFTCL